MRTSLKTKERELTSLNHSINQEILRKHNVEGVDYFNRNRKTELLQKYKINIILLTGLIVLFTSGGFLHVYHYVIGHHLKRLLTANINAHEDIRKGLIPENHIPKGDIGDLIRTRNTMIQKILEMEKNKEELTRMTIFKEIGVAYNHEVNNVLTVIYGQIEKLKECAPDSPALIKMDQAFLRLELIGKNFRERTNYETIDYSVGVKMAKFD